MHYILWFDNTNKNHENWYSTNKNDLKIGHFLFRMINCDNNKLSPSSCYLNRNVQLINYSPPVLIALETFIIKRKILWTLSTNIRINGLCSNFLLFSFFYWLIKLSYFSTNVYLGQFAKCESYLFTKKWDQRTIKKKPSENDKFLKEGF